MTIEARFGKKVVLATDPDFDAEAAVMDFRLTFDGKICSTGNKSNPTNIHEIRRRFHPQLRRLWALSPTLNISPEVRQSEQRRADAFRLGSYRFVPMIIREDRFFCVVDILLLRPAPLASAVYGTVAGSERGDIDGQIATLFDALAKPRHLEQLKGSEAPKDDEDPFYCLLEDDSLITGLSVETGLLLEKTEDGLEGMAARAVVRVRASWPPKDLGYSRWS